MTRRAETLAEMTAGRKKTDERLSIYRGNIVTLMHESAALRKALTQIVAECEQGIQVLTRVHKPRLQMIMDIAQDALKGTK